MTYILMVSSARVSGRRKQYGPYHYAAIVELDPEWEAAHPGERPTMISTRAKGVRRIVDTSGSMWSGGKPGGNSGFQHLLRSWRARVDTLNAG